MAPIHGVKIHFITTFPQPFYIHHVGLAEKVVMDFIQPRHVSKWTVVSVIILCLIIQSLYLNEIAPTEDTGETMVIRDCALDSGSLTTDTELVRSKSNSKSKAKF